MFRVSKKSLSIRNLKMYEPVVFNTKLKLCSPYTDTACKLGIFYESVFFLSKPSNHEYKTSFGVIRSKTTRVFSLCFCVQLVSQSH